MPDVSTVYVPMIESGSYRRDLGERLTEAVAKQIELKTPYKVVGRRRPTAFCRFAWSPTRVRRSPRITLMIREFRRATFLRKSLGSIAGASQSARRE